MLPGIIYITHMVLTQTAMLISLMNVCPQNGTHARIEKKASSCAQKYNTHADRTCIDDADLAKERAINVHLLSATARWR